MFSSRLRVSGSRCNRLRSAVIGRWRCAVNFLVRSPTSSRLRRSLSVACDPLPTNRSRQTWSADARTARRADARRSRPAIRQQPSSWSESRQRALSQRPTRPARGRGRARGDPAGDATGGCQRLVSIPSSCCRLPRSRPPASRTNAEMESECRRLTRSFLLMLPSARLSRVAFARS
jgi:hypothetical protein